jgi:hypothetical protein
VQVAVVIPFVVVNWPALLLVQTGVVAETPGKANLKVTVPVGHRGVAPDTGELSATVAV